MSLDEDSTFNATGNTPVGFEHWLVSEKGKIKSISALYHDLHDSEGQSAIEFTIGLIDGTTDSRRVPLGEGKVREAAQIWIRELEGQSGLVIPLDVAA